MAEQEPVQRVPSPAGEPLGELLAVVAEISSVLDVAELVPTIERQLRRLVDYESIDVFRPEPDGSLVSLREPDCRVRPGYGLVGEAAHRREALFAGAGATAPGTHLALPLVHADRLVGVLSVAARPTSAFSSESVAALRLIASHLAVAVDNALAHRETAAYAGLLATLYEIARETASILDLDALLHRLAEIVKRVIDYEMFGILLLDEQRQELVLRKSVRFKGAGEKARIKVSEGLCGAAVRTKEPVLVEDVDRDPRYVRLVPGTRSELVVPLVHKDRVVGVFDLESTELARFTEEHVKVLLPLASQVAVAVENARLVEELVRREARLHKELSIARRVQAGLLPEVHPAGPRWETSAQFLPARELGGDLYDFYELGDDALAVALGDVAGKGVPAALYAAFASGSVRARAFERRSPGDLMARVNRTLRRRGLPGLFVSLAFGVFDFGARELRLASSGVPYPLHYRAATRRCQPIEVAGLPLGAFDGVGYDEVRLPLAPGDVVLLHTDGLTEARRGDEEYGLERLRGRVEAHAGLDAPDLADHLAEDLWAFLGGEVLADDATFVVVKVR